MKALLKMMKQKYVTLALLSCLTVVAAYAQGGREQVVGVKNFGRVTDQYFRGGAITPEGIENLNKMGVRTIIDLRDTPSADEAPTCKRLGIRYYNFPMTGHDTPTDGEINEILSLIQNAKGQVYVHCSAGKHRAGTLAAMYRIRVQGWSLDKVWAEQQSYGFGAPGGHPELYAYVYERGGASVAMAKSASKQETVKPVKSSKSKEQDADDVKQDSNDEARSAEKSKKESKIAKAKKKDDDDDDKGKDKDDEDDDKDKADKERKKELKRQKKEKSEKAKESAVIAQNEPVAAAKPAANIVANGLFADSRYLTYTEAVQHARAAGGTGEILKLDLEWDVLRNVPTWDITFTSGNEYEVNALNGEVLGNKAKTPAKLATLAPLNLQAAKHLSFTALLRKVAATQQETVVEIELRKIKGQSETIYEVALANGVTLFYDAATGQPVNGI